MRWTKWDKGAAVREDLHKELGYLYVTVGKPSLDQLVSCAAREGRTVGRSALNNLLRGATVPRVETVESFVIACATHARTRRPRIELAPEFTDLKEWRQRAAAAVKRTRDKAQPETAADAPDASDRQLALVLAEYHSDLMERLGLPHYLPAGAHPAALDQPRWVRRLHPSTDPQEALVMPWGRATTDHARMVLLADAGLGKTWLLRMHARLLAEEVLAGPEAEDAALPVLLGSADLAVRPEPTLIRAVTAHLIDLDVVPDTKAARDSLHRWLRAGRILLLVDAIDELPTADSRGRLHRLLATAPAALRLILAGRQAGYTGPPAGGGTWTEYLLEPFGKPEAAAMVQSWPLAPVARASVQARLAAPALTGLTRVPLLLALLCALAEEPGLSGTPDLPASKGALYERILRRLLVHEQRPPAADDTEADRLLSLLAPIAFYFADRPDGWVDIMPRASLLDAIRASGASFAELGTDAVSVLRTLSVEAGVLQPLGDPSAGREQPYVFAHRSLGEYLTARQLAALPEESCLAAVDRHMSRTSRWEEALGMLGRITLIRHGAGRFERLLGHLLARHMDTHDESLPSAIRMLGDLGETGYELPVPLLESLAGEFGTLARQDTETAAVTAAACGSLPDALVDPLAGVLATDPRRYTRSAVRIAHHQQESVTRLLIDGVHRSDDMSDAGAAVTALTHRPGAESLAALMSAFHNVQWPDYTAELGIPHWSAVNALRERRDPALLRQLVADATDGPKDPHQRDWWSWRLRKGALEVLGVYPNDEATAALLEGTTDPHPATREVAFEGLNGRDTPAVRTAVHKALAEPENRRSHLARAIMQTARSLGIEAS
jgi:hypothetical protein